MNELVLGGRLLRHGPMLADDHADAQKIALIAVAHGLAGGRAAVLRGTHP